MSHARIEELSDSDSDPPEDDLDDFADSDIIRSVGQSQPSTFNQRGQLSSKTAPHAPAIPVPQNPNLTRQEFLRPQRPQQSGGPPGFNTTTQPPPEYKTYQCLYPIYFDANKTRQEGRRVGMENAVPNPLARDLVDAVQMLGLKTVFEPGKLHPKDWSNPGRVRVGLKEKGSGGRITNKHHLYKLVSTYLKQHPTTESSPLRLRVQGMPMPNGPLPPPSVPKGWKVNTILPLHSPALSGGGVNENMLKDMMQEMQGAGGAAGGNPMASLVNGMGGGMDGGGGTGSAAGGEPKQGKRKREGKKK